MSPCTGRSATAGGISALRKAVDNASRHDVSSYAMAHESTDRTPETHLPLTPAMFHVLVSLADGEKHGYAILKEVAERTEGAVELSTGTLYGLIKRLLVDGMIRESALGSTERRRAYRLAPFGRKVAIAEAERLRSLVTMAHGKRLLPGPA